MNAERAVELLSQMRDNCVPKDSDAYDDPLRKEKHDALGMAIAQLSNHTGTHARWAHLGRRAMDSLVELGCSHCRGVIAVVPVHEYIYEFCPRCGAKMDA